MPGYTCLETAGIQSTGQINGAGALACRYVCVSVLGDGLWGHYCFLFGFDLFGRGGDGVLRQAS